MATKIPAYSSNGKKKPFNKKSKLLLFENPELQVFKNWSEAEKILSFSGIGIWVLFYSNEHFLGSSDTVRILGLKEPYHPIEFSDLKKMITKKEDKDSLEKNVINLQLNDKQFEQVFKIKTQSNEKKFIKITAGKISKNILGGSITDITEARKIETELIKAKNKAEKADQYKSAFLINLSHELRTPLNAILGFTELLNQSTLNPDQKNEYTKIIRTKANYLLSLIDDINELARFETGFPDTRITEFSLKPLLEELLAEFEKRRIEKGNTNIEISLIIPDEFTDLKVNTDQGRLYQLFSILLNNALKYTEKGLIEFGIKSADDYIKFFVNDTGIGMSIEEQRNVFFRFNQIEETTSGKYGRTGFSLTIARYIVEMLGGSIKVKSELTKGSRFQFSISNFNPMGKNEKTMISDIEELKNKNWKGKIILIAEDEDVNFKFLEAVLQRTQAQILRAINGREVIELCKKIPQIDIVLMDIKMPVMNGYEATREIKKFRPELPVIAQTAFSTQEEVRKCLECGCKDYITKPIDISLLISKIDEYSCSVF